MITKIVITQAHPNIPYSDKLIGIEIPLAEPFYPHRNHRFHWNENTGKTVKNLPMMVKLDDLLESLKDVCTKTYELIKEQKLNSTLILQSQYCKLSR